MTSDLRLQPLVRQRVAALEQCGEAWVASLPQVLAALEENWSLRIGRGLPGGSAAYLADATTTDGDSVVVKVAMPDRPVDDEAAFLHRVAGAGCVRILDHDAVRGALLLERLGAPVTARRSPEEVLDIAVATLQRCWLPASAGVPDPARALATRIESDAAAVDDVSLRDVVEHALRCLDARATDAGPRTWAHGDPHPANLLAAPPARSETGFCFVDPDGVVAEPAYDLGVVIREWTTAVLQASRPRVLVEGYAVRLAMASGEDEQAIWDWGFAHRVATGLYLRSFGAHRYGARFLETAGLLME